MKDDLISRAAALRIFEEHCYPVRYDHNSIERGMTLTGIVEVLNITPPVQQWIPVTEQLPEKSSPWRTGYLATVTSDTWSEPSVMYVEWETTTVRGKEVSRWIWNDKLFPKCWNLVAWMPLPEPAKIEG